MDLTLTGAPLLLALFVFAFVLWATNGPVAASGNAGRIFVLVAATLELVLGLVVLLFTLFHALH
jgi:hypothetical protein